MKKQGIALQDIPENSNFIEKIMFAVLFLILLTFLALFASKGFKLNF